MLLPSSFVPSATQCPVIVITDNEQDEPSITHHQNISSPIPLERFLGGDSLARKVRVKIELLGQGKWKRILDSGMEYLDMKGTSKANKKMRREEHKVVSISFHCVTQSLWWCAMC